MPFSKYLFSIASFSVLALAGAAKAAVSAQPDAAGVDFFEKKIRPVLTEKCYKCHSADSEKIKGGLTLDTREGIRKGGENGPAVVPGKLTDSLLIEAVRYGNKDTAMPPQKAGGKLSESVIKDLEKWVEMGAPDPRGGETKVATRQQETWDQAKKWWAWQNPQKTDPPAVKDAAWAKGEIDRFLLGAMEAKGIRPVGDADRLTLLRRVYFDLVGLPPSPEAIDAYLKDKSGQALEKVVDQLLASPQYGERWGRHWLDVARYAESSGKDVNVAYPHAWRYRDYVVAAFNADKPYDQFLREQLAGDLLPAADDRAKAQQTIATGFLAIGAKGLNEQNPRQFAMDLADEQIDATSQAFLGMTVACARCHDHKFDPIPQRDYYALAGIFLSTETRYGTALGVQNRRPTELIELPAGAGEPVLPRTMSTDERARKEQRLTELRAEQREIIGDRLQGRRPGDGPPPRPNVDPQKQRRLLLLVTQIGPLQAELGTFGTDGRALPLAMGVADEPSTRTFPPFGGFARGGGPDAMIQQRMRERYGRAPEFRTISDSALYARGDVDKPGEKVPRGFLELLTHSTPPAIPAKSSGRKELAEWMVSSENPLTARVMVNRVWHWLFGQGIVTSTDNFGTTGTAPSNQALLDTLAVEFRDSGWSVKKLVREIVLSHAYQLASTYQPANFAADPENALCWRANKRRLDAECIRDAVLAASGQLEMKPALGSLIAASGDGPIGANRFIGISEATIVDAGATTNVRSLYLPIARDILPDALSIFDFPEPSLVAGTREVTNVPAQALFLLNSKFVETAGKKVANRLLTTYPGGATGSVTANMEQRVTLAYWLMFSRGPTPAEQSAAAAFLGRFPGNWKKGDTRLAVTHDAAAVEAAWTSFCRSLIATAEFRYLN